MTTFAKMISSQVRNALSMAMLHMSLDTLQGAAASAALVAGVSLVSTMLAGDWAILYTAARHYFSTYLTTTDCNQDPVQHAGLGLHE